MDFLDKYEEQIMVELLRHASDAGVLDGQLLAAEELDDRWLTSAPAYMAAAVPEIAKYPLVAIVWAGYVGIGAAVLWDMDWEQYKDVEDLYSLLAQPRGFDNLDEYVLEGLLGYDLEGEMAQRIENIMRSAAQLSETLIRKEEVEAQSVQAFHIFARTTKVIYRLGVAIGLKELGYKYEKVMIN